MGRSMSQRKAKAYEDIERLKANRRKDLIKLSLIHICSSYSPPGSPPS